MSIRHNDGSHYQDHPCAAELHDIAAHAHRTAAEAHEKQDHQTRQERSGKRLSTPTRLYGAPNRSIGSGRMNAASVPLCIAISPNWRMRCGKHEAVRKDRRKDWFRATHELRARREGLPLA
jgi:hypothetical protein